MASLTPYLIPLSVVLLSTAQGTLMYSTSPGQRVYIREWRWTSTGIFDLYDVRVQTSLRITNSSLTTPIKSTHLQNPGNAFLGIKDFMPEWVIEPNNTLYLDVKDTSVAGNTIVVTLVGRIEYLSGSQ